MKLYRTKEDNLINLEQVVMIYKDPHSGIYHVSSTNGITYEMPEIELNDIEKIMDYNDYLIK